MSEIRNPSPRWGSTTKLVVALTIVAIVAALLIKFQSILPPLIMAFILVYLLYPAASFLNKKLHISWGISVTLVYVVLTLILLGGLAVGGLEMVNQVQSLIALVQSSLEEIPTLVERFSTQVIAFGPFQLDLSHLDLNSLSDQLIANIQPLLGETGVLIGRAASGAINVLGWTAFVLLVSYFILAESGGLREGIVRIELPRYNEDMQRMTQKLGRIWNAFLRGQLILVTISATIYTFVLGVLGVRYALGLAILAGLARFLPYVGPAISWSLLAIVTFFQPAKLFDMSPLLYTLGVLVIAWVIDGILDSVVSPRIMAHALKVHPAAVMVAAIVSLDLLGVLGVVIAAPFLATLKLVGEYLLRKMFDLDPWEGSNEMPEPPPLREQFRAWIGWVMKYLPIGKKA